MANFINRVVVVKIDVLVLYEVLALTKRNSLMW